MPEYEIYSTLLRLKGMCLGIFSRLVGNNPIMQEYSMTPHSRILQFDPLASVAICVGIDEQYDPKFPISRRLTKLTDIGKIATFDAKAMKQEIGNKLGITQTKMITASENGDNCTKKGLGAVFEEYAKKVGENGAFIFYFSGHGCISAKDSKCYLIPKNFVPEEGAVSMYNLLEWLHNAECKAINVLFIFDCCYAGDLGKQLKEVVQPGREIKPQVSVAVLSACTGEELNTTIPELGNGIFTYFLRQSLDCLTTDGIATTMNKVIDLCASLSSLIYLYKDNKLKHGKMHPCFDIHYLQMFNQRCCNPTDDIIQSIITSLIEKYKLENLIPPTVVHDWIASDEVKKSLHLLSQPASSCKSLKLAILSAMLYTSAVLLYAKKEKEKPEDIGTFLAIIQLLKLKGVFYGLSVDNLLQGLQRYYTTVENLSDLSTNTELLRKLYYQVKALQNVPSRDSGDT